MRRICLGALLLTATACSLGGGDSGRDSPRISTSSPGSSVPKTLGWSLRDDVPYARLGQTMVLDEGNDRLILFGGAANDLWALPLSGPHAKVWAQLIAAGDYPPAHVYASPSSDYAAYDAIAQRMLLLRGSEPFGSGYLRLWELSLNPRPGLDSATPRWKELLAGGPSPGNISGPLALDTVGRRLFALGGDDAGLWQLSLGEKMEWTRSADVPTQYFYASSLFFDGARQQIVAVQGRAPGALWAFSLKDLTWTLLDRGSAATTTYGADGVIDVAGNRIVIVNGEDGPPIGSFSLVSKEWTQGTAAGAYDASAVLDARRGRILRFGGWIAPSFDSVTNAVSQLALDTLTESEFVPASRRRELQPAGNGLVWDPVRQGVVGYGNGNTSDTWLHGLAASDTWTKMTTVGGHPFLSSALAVFDPGSPAILAYVGNDTNLLVRLASAPKASWQTVDVGGGPTKRSSELTVLDETNHRLVIYGGVQDANDPSSAMLDDCWTLSLDRSMGWTQLEPSGQSPGARSDLVGIDDPDDERMLVMGGGPEVYSLSLGDEPEWSMVNATGQAPGVAVSAIYDPTGHRMIVLTYDKPGAAHLFALDLGEAPRWHQFCTMGLTIGQSADGDRPSVITRVPDGLFLSISGGAFRFDLATPYCDG